IECRFVVDDDHRAAAEHVRWTHENGIANLARDAPSFFQRDRSSVVRLRNIQLAQQVSKPFAVFRKVDRFGRGSDNRHTRMLQIQSEVQRRLSAELYDHAVRLLFSDNVKDIFQRKRLEVKTVRGIVIGRYRFRIAVHHDRLVALFLQGKRCMATAIIELNPLPDPVRTASQDDDLLSIPRAGLIFLFVGRVKVGRIGLELGRACIYALVHRNDAIIAPLRRNITRLRIYQERNTGVGKAGSFSFGEKIRRQAVDSVLRNVFDQIRDFLHLIQEPRIDVSQLDQLSDAEASAYSMEKVGNTVRGGRNELLPDEIFID